MPDCAYLQSFTLDTPRLINKDIGPSTHGNPARSLVKGYRLEFLSIVDINRLEECLWTAEDDQCVAGDVCLLRMRAGAS